MVVRTRRAAAKQCSPLHASGRGSHALRLLLLAATARAADVDVATENQTCTDICTDVVEFLTNLKQATEGKDLNSAQICRARQVGFQTFRCVLNNPATCLSVHENFQCSRNDCLRIGIDTMEAEIRSNYSMTLCQMCSLSRGGSQVKVTFGVTLPECEADCEANPVCAAFDYDAVRYQCRIWDSCGLSARSGRFGCQWTIYDKPGFTAPTQAAPSRESASITTSSTTAPSDCDQDCEFQRNMAVVDSSRRPLPQQLAILTVLLYRYWPL